MSNEQHSTATLMARLIFPIALVVIVGIAQIVLAFRLLDRHLSNHWSLTITLVGTLFSMAIVVYTAINIINKAQAAYKRGT